MCGETPRLYAHRTGDRGAGDWNSGGCSGPPNDEYGDRARTNGTKQSLFVLRDAIELYRSQSGSYPPAATLSTALQPYLSGPFPIAQVGTNQNAAVAASTQNPITSVETGAFGWAYNQTTGEIRVNDSSSITW